jgi:hypothetical protein
MAHRDYAFPGIAERLEQTTINETRRTTEPHFSTSLARLAVLPSTALLIHG